MEASISAGPVVGPGAAKEKRERIRGALAHLRAHGSLDAFAASQSEKIAIVTIARKQRLLVPRRDWGYRLTSRGRRYCAGPEGRKASFTGLLACFAGVAALAALGYGIVDLRTPRVSSVAMTAPAPAVLPVASLPTSSAIAEHEMEPLALAPLRVVETTGTAAGVEPPIAPPTEAARVEPAPVKKDVKKHRSTSRSRVGARTWQRWTGPYRPASVF